MSERGKKQKHINDKATKAANLSHIIIDVDGVGGGGTLSDAALKM